MCLMILFNLRGFMFWFVSYDITPGQFGFAFNKYFNVCRLRDRMYAYVSGCMCESVCLCVCVYVSVCVS